MNFKSISILLTGLMLVGFMGCADCNTSGDAAEKLNLKWKSLTDSQLTSHNDRITALENRQPIARSVAPSAKTGVSNASYVQFSDGSSIDDALNNPPEGLQSPAEPIEPTEPIEPAKPEVTVEPAAPTKQYSRPQGPVTYGSPRTSGYREETTYKTVRRVVEERVPVKVKVPVQMRDVYETVTEDYQVPITRNVCVTETRQRTKTIMVPQTVVEDYTVQVPKQVTQMVTRTRSRRVKVGEEEVDTPTAAPQAIMNYEEPEMTYQSAPPIQVQAMTTFQPAPVMVAAPAVVVERPTIATRLQNRQAGIELTRSLNMATPMISSSAIMMPAAAAAPGLVGCADGSCQLNYQQSAQPATNVGTARPTAGQRIRTMFPRLSR